MIHLILVLVIFGFFTWLIMQIPMPALIKNLILGVVCILIVLWVLQVLGVATGFPRIDLR